MVHMLFAEEASGSGISALGISPSAFIIQLLTFVVVILLLKRYAFKPITRMLAERRKVIDDGVRMGLRMEKEKAKLDQDVAKVMAEARTEADKIISIAQKEARDITREAEKLGQRKAEAMVVDAQARIAEEARQAKKNLEKDIVGLVSEATEAIVGEKVDAKKDAELIDKALKGRK